jgi:DNA-binding transcriptional ArsR family regulator
MNTPSALRVLAALAQESRLAIYRLLVQQGPAGMAAGTIAERLGVAAATLSFHLKELAYAQLITPRQEGRYIYYSANYESMNGLIAFLTENCCGEGTSVQACRTATRR